MVSVRQAPVPRMEPLELVLQESHEVPPKHRPPSQGEVLLPLLAGFLQDFTHLKMKSREGWIHHRCWGGEIVIHPGLLVLW